MRNENISIDSLKYIKNKIIIVDSCILLYCEGYNYKLEIRNILRTLVNNGNRLAISKLSGFEVLKNIQKNKHTQYFLSLLDYIKNIEVTETELVNADLLFRAYKKHKISHYKNISSCDYIIGGTVLGFKDAILFTANRKDFPTPIWKVVKNLYLVYEIYEEFKALNFYFLEPDISKL